MALLAWLSSTAPATVDSATVAGLFGSNAAGLAGVHRWAAGVVIAGGGDVLVSNTVCASLDGGDSPGPSVLNATSSTTAKPPPCAASHLPPAACRDGGSAACVWGRAGRSEELDLTVSGCSIVAVRGGAGGAAQANASAAYLSTAGSGGTASFVHVQCTDCSGRLNVSNATLGAVFGGDGGGSEQS